MSFFSIDFDYCREQGRIISALQEDCGRLALLLRADGQEELAVEADALGAEMPELCDAVFAAVLKKETADTQILLELGQRGGREGN